MKNVILALSVLFVLAACGKSSGGGGNNNPQVGPQGFAAIDLPPECGGPNRTAMPYEYDQTGCSPYNWDNGRFRHGGCPSRTFAACAAGVGMICVPQDVYSTNQIAWYNYQDGNRQMQFCGYEGAQNHGACNYRSAPGAGNIGRACIVGGVSDCGYGHCQPVDTRGSMRDAGGDVRGDARGDDRRDDWRGDDRRDDWRGDDRRDDWRDGDHRDNGRWGRNYRRDPRRLPRGPQQMRQIGVCVQ